MWGPSSLEHAMLYTASQCGETQFFTTETTERQHPELGPIQTIEWAVGEKKHPEDSHKRIDGDIERPGDRPLAIEFLG